MFNFFSKEEKNNNNEIDQIKKIKIEENKKLLIKKNDFKNINIKFKSSPYFISKIKKKDIKNFNKIIDINFECETEKQKFEIFLNNFLKINLNNNQNKTKLKCNVIGCGESHSFIFNKKENKLFLFGDNKYNQLGVYETRVLNSITNNIIQNFNLNFSKIKKFEIGGNHNLILFENNDLYSFGGNYFGECGINNKNHEKKKILFPEQIKFPCFKKFDKNKKIKNIFCGYVFCFVLLGFFILFYFILFYFIIFFFKK